MIIFFLARISGDPIEMLLPIEATDEEFEQVRAAWGLDKPLPVQYITYLGNVLRGNFGQSIFAFFEFVVIEDGDLSFRLKGGLLPSTPSYFLLSDRMATNSTAIESRGIGLLSKPKIIA